MTLEPLKHGSGSGSDKKCLECGDILTPENTKKRGFRLSFGLWYFSFNLLCDRCTPRLITLSRNDSK